MVQLSETFFMSEQCEYHMILIVLLIYCVPILVYSIFFGFKVPSWHFLNYSVLQGLWPKFPVMNDDRTFGFPFSSSFVLYLTPYSSSCKIIVMFPSMPYHLGDGSIFHETFNVSPQRADLSNHSLETFFADVFACICSQLFLLRLFPSAACSNSEIRLHNTFMVDFISSSPCLLEVLFFYSYFTWSQSAHISSLHTAKYFFCSRPFVSYGPAKVPLSHF